MQGYFMTHPIYQPYARTKNQALINSLVHPKGQDTMVNACRAHQGDFSPSLYLEIDWQRFRPDLDDSNLKQILDLVHGLLFVIGFPTSMEVRDQGRGTIRLERSEVSHLEPIFDAWQDVWFRPEGRSVLEAFDQFVEGLRTPARRALEVDVRASALKRLDHSLGKVTDLSNLASIAGQILLNAQFAFLDLPWTRRAVRASIEADSEAFMSVLPADQPSRRNPKAIAAHLRQRATDTTAPGAEQWVALLREAAERIAAVDLARLTGDEGDWTDGLSYCGQCAMWFASRTVAAMDDRVSFARSSARHIIYMPQDLMVCSCPFCGFAAPSSVPTLFYAEQRGQVIYLAPSHGGISDDEAISFWTPAIQGLQKRYLDRRGEAVSHKFQAAGELVTHDLAAFFYAIQMGDTIAEDHVFNMIVLADGSALVFDGEKGFARVLTLGEAEVFRSRHRVEATKPELAARLFKDGQTGRVPTLDDVDDILRVLAGANDAFDADLEKSRLKTKGNP